MGRTVKIAGGLIGLGIAAVLYFFPYYAGQTEDGRAFFVYPLGLIIAVGIGGVGLLISGIVNLDNQEDALDKMLKDIPYAASEAGKTSEETGGPSGASD